MKFENRINKLTSILNNQDIDALALVPGSNFQYITGGNFHLLERPTLFIISKKSKPVAILPVLELDSFSKLGIDAEIFAWQDSDGYQHAFDNAFNHLGNIANIGVEGQRMRVFEMQAIKSSLKSVSVINAQKIISQARLLKDKQEIEFINKAIKIAELALEDTIKFVKVDKTEIEIKNFLIQKLYQYGAEGLAFDPIVLAADNSALPHGHSRNDYHIKKGDCLLFDFGATVKGYNSDMTRTFFVGSASDEFKKIYGAVLKANLEGINCSKPGVSLHKVDDDTLNSLANSGYEELIVHKTGHGLGLDVHEDPYVMRKNYDLLEEGMVITIEPGLYQKGSLGVRIEDDVLITNDGCKSLTNFPKELKLL